MSAGAGQAPGAGNGGVPGCPACGLSVRLSRGELERLIDEYFRGGTPELVSGAEAEARLAICVSCPELQYGSTCRHCGCLVEVRVRLAGRACPAPEPRW